MIKKLLLLSVLIITIFMVSSCSREEKSLILFNHNPITRLNVLENATDFKVDERIYFIYMTKKNLEGEDIRIKIFKRDSKANGLMNTLVYSNDFRLKKGEINYFTDYIVMQKSGDYAMLVFRKDNLWRADAIADFRVNSR